MQDLPDTAVEQVSTAVVVSQCLGHVCAGSCTSASSHALQHQEAFKDITCLNLCLRKRREEASGARRVF
jgi:hypothetical protein